MSSGSGQLVVNLGADNRTLLRVFDEAENRVFKLAETVEKQSDSIASKVPKMVEIFGIQSNDQWRKKAGLDGMDQMVESAVARTRMLSIAFDESGEAALQSSTKKGRLGLRLLELSRGAEDLAAGFSTRGLQGAILGSANNMAAFAATFSPMAGAIAGVAGAITLLLAPALQKLVDVGKVAMETVSEVVERWTSTQSDRMTPFEPQPTTADSWESQLKRDQHELRNLQEELRLTTKLRDDMAQNVGLQQSMRGIWGADEKDVEALARLNEEVTKLESKIGLLQIDVDVDQFQFEENLVREGTVAAEKAADRLSKKFNDQWNAAERGASQDFAKARLDEQKRIESGALARLKQNPDMTLTGSLAGTTAETSAIARAARMGSQLKDPTPEAIDKAVKEEIKEMKRHETILNKIKDAAEKFAAPVGVPV